jgi:hypothetical protein
MLKPVVPLGRQRGYRCLYDAFYTPNAGRVYRNSSRNSRGTALPMRAMMRMFATT